METPRLPGQRIYDLYLIPDRTITIFNENDRGVSLTDDSIAWISAGVAETAPLANIESIRLQFQFRSGGYRTYRKCYIKFNDGRQFAVTDWNGSFNNVRAADYRVFVHDLHNRLAISGSPSVRYLVGDTPLQRRIRLTFFAVIFALGLTFILLQQPSLIVGVSGAVLLAALLGVIWFSSRLNDKSTPREYQPPDLPEDMLG